jgi:sugar/nucleoside kinase (ribokinase family)
VIVLFTSTEPRLEHHRRQLTERLRSNGNGALTIRHAPQHNEPAGRERAMRDVDVVICLIGGSMAPELPDGSGYAEVEVATARRLGVRVLAYSHATDGAAPTAADPLEGYRVARARRFHNWMREHYGVRRFTTPQDLIAGVLEDLEGVHTDNGSPDPPAIRQFHARLRARRTTTFDAYAISLHNMDAIYRVEQIAPFREETVDSPRCSPGGAGANLAYALARLGMTTAVAGATADDADGAALRADLEHAGVHTNLLLRLDASSPLCTGRSHILADAAGQRSIFTEAGANSRFAAELDARGLHTALLDDLEHSKVVLLTSFDTVAEQQLQEDLLTRLPPDTLVAYTPGSLYNSPGARRLAPIIRRANVLFLSQEALARLLDDVVPHIHDQTASIPHQTHRLIQWRNDLGARDPVMIVVRRPWRGYDARDGLRHIYVAWGQQGLEEGVTTQGRLAADDIDKIIDGTGTGGALAAGVLYALLRSRPPEDCANLAFVVAMSTATRYGSRAGVPSRETIAQRWCYWLKADDAPSWL